MTTRVKLLAVLLGLALLGFLGMQLAHAVSGSGTQSVGPAVTVTAPSSTSATTTGAGSAASVASPAPTRPPLNNAQRATLRSLLIDVAENAHQFASGASDSTTTAPAGTVPAPANVAPAPAPSPEPAALAPAPQRLSLIHI